MKIFLIILQPFHKGIYLLEYLCGELAIKEKDYFGLRYVDSSKQRVSCFTKDVNKFI